MLVELSYLLSRMGSYTIAIAMVLMLGGLLLPWWADSPSMMSLMPGGLSGGFGSLVKWLTQSYEVITGARGFVALTEEEGFLLFLGFTQLLALFSIISGVAAIYYLIAPNIGFAKEEETPEH